jgi:hypothetical protein
VDTPGFNDPNQVREDVTLQYLARAHAYVLVLNATQALNQSVVQLLRQLVVGLQKERVVVFLNHLDGLAVIGRDYPKVVRFVGEKLGELFPGVPIPVIAGCAWWGELACQKGNASLKEADCWRKAAAYGAARGFISAEQIRTWLAEPEGHWRDLRQALYRASGIPDMLAAIQRTLLRGRGLTLLTAARGQLRLRAQANAGQFATEAGRLDHQAAELEAGLASAQKELEGLRKKMGRQKSQKGQLSKVREEAEAQLWSVVKQELKKVDQRLASAIEGFASRQAKELEKNFPLWEGQWEVSLSECRTDIESQFQDAYDKARGEVTREQGAFLRRLRRALEDIDEELAQAVDFVPPGEVDPAPSVAAVRKAVCLDLGWFLTRLLARVVGGAAVRARELRVLICESLAEARAGLARSAREAIEHSVRLTLDNFDNATRLCVGRLEAWQRQDQQTYEALARSNDPAERGRAIQDLRDRAGGHRARAAELTAFAEEIAKLPLPGGGVPTGG